MPQALVEKIIEEQRKPPAFQDMVHLVTVLDAQVLHCVLIHGLLFVLIANMF